LTPGPELSRPFIEKASGIFLAVLTPTAKCRLLVPVHEGEVREEPDGEARPSVAGRESPLHADFVFLPSRTSHSLEAVRF